MALKEVNSATECTVALKRVNFVLMSIWSWKKSTHGAAYLSAFIFCWYKSRIQFDNTNLWFCAHVRTKYFINLICSFKMEAILIFPLPTSPLLSYLGESFSLQMCICTSPKELGCFDLYYSKTCFERSLKFATKIGRKRQVTLQCRVWILVIFTMFCRKCYNLP